MARRMIEEDKVNVLLLSDRGREPRLRPRARPAGNRRAAPLPHPRGPAHAGEPGPGDRRGARGPPLLAADRLRLQRDQPLRGLREDRRHDPRGHALRHRPQDRLQELRQGRHQGRHQGDVEDGHLRDPELPRRPGFRGAGAAAGRDRPVLHVDPVPRRRHRARRNRAGGPSRHHAAFPERAGQRPRPARRRPVPVAQATASSTFSTPSRSTACRRRSAPAATPPSRSTRGSIDDQRQAVHAARPPRIQDRRRPSRSRRSSRWRRS